VTITSNEVGPPSGAARQPEEVESLSHSSPSAPEDDLGSFFRVLAASFAHARDRRGARSSRGASKNPQQGDSPKPARRLWSRPILLAAALCVVLVWIAPLLLAAREVVVPDTLVGSWTTSAPLYSDRGFTITKTSLTLKLGPKGTIVPVHPITRVRIDRSGEGMVYTIDYLMENAPWEFSFRLWPGSPPVIRSVNQPEVAWQKEDDKHSPSSQAAHYR
jgi:hypothetical protein